MKKLKTSAKLCSVCGLKAPYVCSVCKSRHYCSFLHQRKDWRTHRTICQSNSQTNGNTSSNCPEEFLVAGLKDSGIFITDNFVNEGFSSSVQEEVRRLYATEGAFTLGKCLSSTEGDHDNVRGDKIAWLSGNEKGFPAISKLVEHLNHLVVRSVNSTAGQVLNCKITGRSKVMISCFPGEGTHYKLHIDNPSDNGHVLSAQFFLSSLYDASRDGGLLRVQKPGCVLDIEPRQGRLVIHWSDGRTPHEVLPSFSERFSITIWYTGVQSKTLRAEQDEKHHSATCHKFPTVPSAKYTESLITQAVLSQREPQQFCINTNEKISTNFSQDELLAVVKYMRKYGKYPQPLVKSLGVPVTKESSFMELVTQLAKVTP